MNTIKGITLIALRGRPGLGSKRALVTVWAVQAGTPQTNSDPEERHGSRG